AVAQFERVVHLFPDNFNAQYELGVAYDEQGKTDDAMDHLKEAVRLQPGNPYARDYLAYLYAKNDELDKAVSETRPVIEKMQENLRAQSFLAYLYRKQSRTAEFEHQVKIARRLKAEILRSQPERPAFDDIYYEACFDALCGDNEASLGKLEVALAEGV